MKGKMNGMKIKGNKIKGKKLTATLLIAVFILSTITLSIPLASATTRTDDQASIMFSTNLGNMPTWTTSGPTGFSGDYCVVATPGVGTDRLNVMVFYGKPFSVLNALPKKTDGASQSAEPIEWNLWATDDEVPTAFLYLDSTGDGAIDTVMPGGFNYPFDSATVGVPKGRWAPMSKTAGSTWQLRDYADGVWLSGTYTGNYKTPLTGSKWNDGFSMAELAAAMGSATTGLTDPIVLYVGYGYKNNQDPAYFDDIIIGDVTYPLEPPTYIATTLASSASVAEWATDTDYGRVVILDTDSAATTSDYAIARVTPTTTLDITLATITSYLPEFSYNLITPDTLNYLALEMYFETAAGGTAEVTIFPYTSATPEWANTAGWKRAYGHSGSTYAVAYGATDDGTAISLATGSTSLTTVIASIDTLATEATSTYILKRVGVQIGWVGVTTDMVAHVDYIKINSTTYNLEPYPVLNKAWYFTGDTATISYTNNLENSDASSVDLVPVTSDSDSDSARTVVLTETGANTDIFTGSISLVASTPGTGQVLVRPDDTFWVADASISTVRDTGTIDDTVPTVTTLTPARNEITTDNQTTISAAVDDTNFEVAYMTVDGEFRGNPRSTAGTLTYTPDTLNLLSEGLHTVVVHAEDLAGNVNTTTWTFTVDTMKPTATISMNVTGDVKACDVEFYATFSEGMVNATNIVFSDNLTSIFAWTTPATKYWTANDTYTMEATIDGSYNGSAQVNVTGATDLAGKTMVEASYDFYIDTVDPTAPGKLNATALADSIDLEWSASADFGGMDKYKVYRGTATGACNTLVDSVDHPIVTFTDTTLLASDIYFYEVKAYDEAGNFATSNEANATFITEEVTSYNVTLAKDWNIFSVPLIPDNTSIEVVLADVMENVSIVWSYTDGEWLSYIPGLPSGVNELTDIEDGIGYWILMSAADTATVSGLELPGPGELPPVYPVDEGWNLIGFKSVASMAINTYLTTIPDLVLNSSVCYGWDATLQGYEMVYIAGTGLIDFEPGQGYWLYLTEDANIAPPEP